MRGLGVRMRIRLLVAVLLSMFAGVLASTAPASAQQQWVPCAVENGVCRTPYPTTVRYGARGAFAVRQANGVIACNNRTFGDPLYGVVKGCAYLARQAAFPAQGPRGSYARTCRACQVAGPSISCQCQRRDGSWGLARAGNYRACPGASLTNNNGNLVCGP